MSFTAQNYATMTQSPTFRFMANENVLRSY